MQREYPLCREVKFFYNGKSAEAECGLVHLESGLGVLEYYFDRRWRVDELVLGPPMYTHAFYWTDRPYNVYLWYDGEGSFTAAYFNIADQVKLSPKRMEYRDLYVDLLMYPDGRQVLLDKHELPADFPRELRRYIEEAENRLQSEAGRTVDYARMFLAVRGIDTWFRGLETENLMLEPPSAAAADEYAAYYSRNSEFLASYGPARDPHYCSPEAQAALAEQELNDSSVIRMWLRHRRDNRIIGSIKFSNIIRGPFQSCFAGYALDSEYTNRGYMSEGLSAAVDYLFRMERLHRIEANIIPGNLPSQRVVEKLGFLYEGRARKYLFINGKWRDHLHMVLLNEDGENQGPA